MYGGCAWGVPQLPRGILKELKDITERSEALVRGTMTRSHSTQGHAYTLGVPRSASWRQMDATNSALTYGPLFSDSISLSVNVFQAADKLRGQGLDPFSITSPVSSSA